MSVCFLSNDQILRIHQDQIDRYGGSHGVRDVDLLMSAIAQPEATFGGEYLHADIFEMAAAYLFHLTNNHPFIDGNKRVGGVAALVFLYTNGIKVQVSEDRFEQLVMKVAQGQCEKSVIAAFFKEHAVPKPDA